MSLYQYRAVNSAGVTEEGEIEAAAEPAAIASLQDAGYVPLLVQPATTRKALRRSRRASPGRRFGRRGVSAREVANFTREMATLLNAGIPLDRALQTLTEVAEDSRLQTLTNEIYEQIREGKSFSDALAAQGQVFSELYIHMIRAGETAGALDATLRRLSEHLKRAKRLKDTVVSALTYPLVLLVVAGLSVIVLLTFVIPQFAQMFEDMGAALPLPTRVTMAAAEWLKQWWWTLPLLFLVLAALAKRLLARRSYKLRWDGLVLRLPLVGDFTTKIELARFTHTLAVMLASGVSLLNALRIGSSGMANLAMAQAVESATAKVQQGETLAASLEQSERLPKLAVKMIRVGEESGQLEGMLEQMAAIYDEETQLAVQRLLSLLEPVLIVGLGLLIAGIIMSILIAILGMNQLVF